MKILNSFSFAPLALGLALSLALVSGGAQAITYSVNIDTRSITGTTGSVDFQWNLGAVDPLLTASVASFSNGSTLTDAPVLLSGNFTGSLASGNSLNFDGASSFNYAYQDMTFGSSISFMLTLPDAAPTQSDPTSDSAFFVSVLDANQRSALSTTSVDNQALAFTLQSGGAPTFEAYTTLATVSSVSSVSAVPEPGTVALMLVGMGGLAGMGALRRRSARQTAKG